MSDDVLNDPLLPMRFISDDRHITPRAVRKQIASGTFPPPDANIGGRNYWRASTYAAWKKAVLAGEFAKASRLAQGRESRRNSA